MCEVWRERGHTEFQHTEEKKGVERALPVNPHRKDSTSEFVVEERLEGHVTVGSRRFQGKPMMSLKTCSNSFRPLQAKLT